MLRDPLLDTNASLMELELISFKLCPFVQSTMITLLQHQVDYKITYIDINDPPQWFDELSPSGEVPILRVNNAQVIFESTVLNEYINDANNCGMASNEPLQRALERSWTLFCGSIFGDLFNLVGASDEATLKDVEYDIQEKLDKLEVAKSDTSCFSSNEIGLIDTSYAGLFMRLDLIKTGRNVLDASRFPKLSAWSQHLLSLESVKKSVVPEFPEMYMGMVKMRDGFINQNL